MNCIFKKIQSKYPPNKLSELITKIKIKKMTNNYNDILPKEKAIELGIFPKNTNNGVGNRCIICKLYYVTYIYSDKTLPKTYPIDLDITYYSNKISKFKINNKSNKGIIGFIIHCDNNDKSIKRPIRKDIKTYYKKYPCVICAKTSELICDHKNDLYNNPRVLNTKTQSLDDFQSLCNSCNLRKRAISILTRKTCIRYGATNLPHMKPFGIDYVGGDDTLNFKDPDALIGTYYYDPIVFNTKLKNILINNL